MKKILAVLLSILCIFSCFSVSSFAADEYKETFEELLDVTLPEGETLGYGIFYEMDTLSGVSIMYKPSPSISFSNPGTYTIKDDTPLSIDYEFVCWKHSKTNKLYYAGDKIYVDGQITLYAVWEEKTDNDVRAVRIIKTAIESLRRLIGKFFSIFDAAADAFEPDEPTTQPAYTALELTADDLIVNYDLVNNYNIITFYINSEYVFDTNMATGDYIYFQAAEYTQAAYYPVELTITNETTTVNGETYQYITARFLDGVPVPPRATRITFTIPENFLIAPTGDVTYASKEITGSFLTTNSL